MVTPAAAAHQAMAIEYGVHGADGRQRNPQVAPFDLLADLRRTPAGVLFAQMYDQGLDLEGQSVRLPIRASGPIREPYQAAILVSGVDLVASLARDIELPAQPSHPLPVEQPSHKPQPFIHFATLLPGHLRLPQSPKVSAMCPE